MHTSLQISVLAACIFFCACAEPVVVPFSLTFPSERAFYLTEGITIDILEYEEDLCTDIISQGATGSLIATLTTDACEARAGALVEDVAAGKYILYASGQNSDAETILEGCVSANISQQSNQPINITLIPSPDIVFPDSTDCSTIEEKCNDGVRCSQ